MENQREPANDRQWLIIGSLVVVLLCLFGPMLFGGHLFKGYFVNLYHYYFFAAQQYLIFTLHQVPNWYPHFFSGFPISLTLDGFLNPIFVLALKYLPVLEAYHWLTLLFFVANILSCYACGRTLGLSKQGSWVAAWSYGFSGIVIRWADVIVFTSLFPVLPLSFIACYKIYHGSKRWWWLFAAMLTYGWIGGFAELLVYNLIAVGAFSIFLLLSSRAYNSEAWIRGPMGTAWKFSKEAVKKFLAPVMISVALVSPWLLTLLHFITHDSNRAHGLTLTESSSMPITLSHFIHMIMPRLTVFYGGNIPFLHLEDDIDFYLGTIPLIVLLLLPFLWKKIAGKEKYFFLGLLAFGFLMSFRSPVYVLLQQLPVLNWFRWHFKWAFITVFPAAILAGYAFDALPNLYQQKRAKVAVIVAWVFFSLAALGSLIVVFKADAIKALIVSKGTAQYSTIAVGAGRELPRSADYYHWLISNMADSFVRAIGLANGYTLLTFFLWFVALGAITLGFFPKFVSVKNRNHALILATCSGALIWFGFLTGFDRAYLTTEPETAKYLHAQNPYQQLPINREQGVTQIPYRIYAYFPDQTVSALQDRYRISLVDHDIRANLSREMLGDNINTWFGFDGAENREPLVLESVLEMNAMVFGRSATSSVGSLESQLAGFSTEKRARLLGLMNIKYVLTPHELSGPWKKTFASKTTEGVSVNVYENPFFLPRWYFAKDVKWDLTPQQLGDENVTWLQRNDLDYVLPPTKTDLKDALELVNYTAGNLTLQTKTSAPRWVVFSEAYVPYWQGFIDGKEVPLHHANYEFQAIYVPAGTHEVEFRYPGFLDQFRKTMAAYVLGK